MNKIIKTSKIIQKILSFLFWLVIGITTISTIAIIIALSIKRDTTLSNGLTIIIGNYKLLLNQSYSLQEFAPLLFTTLANLVVFGGLSCYTIKILLKIFKPMSQGQPFSASISIAFKKLAYAVLIFGFTRIVLQIITNYFFYETFDIATLFAADRVASCTVSIVTDGSFILWFFILLLLSHIFKYGEALQQLSDETL